jgi:hypothetical protein
VKFIQFLTAYANFLCNFTHGLIARECYCQYDNLNTSVAFRICDFRVKSKEVFVTPNI